MESSLANFQHIYLLRNRTNHRKVNKASRRFISNSREDLSPFTFKKLQVSKIILILKPSEVFLRSSGTFFGDFFYGEVTPFFCCTSLISNLCIHLYIT